MNRKKCAQKEFDRADIVRDVRFPRLPGLVAAQYHGEPLYALFLPALTHCEPNMTQDEIAALSCKMWGLLRIEFTETDTELLPA